jgi:hypothetical protein
MRLICWVTSSVCPVTDPSIMGVVSGNCRYAETGAFGKAQVAWLGLGLIRHLTSHVWP